jgi:acetyltransferase
VFKDRALGLPPLNDVLARRMMEQTKIYTALRGVRGQKSVDMAQLEQVVVAFSRLVVDQPWIKEIEINPLLAGPQGLIALDARVVLNDATTPPSELPKPSIRPYPSQYLSKAALPDKTEVTIRPIRPEDEPLMVGFHRGLSDESVRLRYFCSMSLAQRTTHERLVRVCLSDYDRQIVLVATRYNNPDQREEIVGVGRLSRIPATRDAEFAIVVGDQWQHRGLGTHLLQAVINAARAEGVERVIADILTQNTQMQKVCKRLGFALQAVTDDQLFHAELRL